MAGTDATNMNPVQYGADGSQVLLTYRRPPVISGQGATVTLTASQSGADCLFDRAAGIVYTLPAPVIGMYFDFEVLITITSNAAKVITDAGTTFLLGSILSMDTDSGVATVGFTANGSSITNISMNGTTTGAIKGTRFRVRCISTTIWIIEGIVLGSGTVLTPFA